ncbi:uncharacterized protein LOC122246661 isoform X2 [Penaeus japonicus]|uniref:uncharacterized protein LOC122246661 isoform X2 n=1 Tax=Penaeus japonicus TaxID=27405 RepID=UPI001C71292A|nr:uncharacterized protein LOC122246661 isoform X2 [Penaeus japonicus]
MEEDTVNRKMNIPTFIRREWYGHGRAVLTFFHTGTNGESAEATSLNKEGGVIECYTSSVLISEYAEKGQADRDVEEKNPHDKPVEEENPHDKPVEEENPHDKPVEEIDKCSQNVPIETWQNWLVHWEAWKEVYISLSWVHKYRQLCKPDYIQWYDSYIEDYPDILPLITEGLGEVTENLESFHNYHNEQEDSLMETGTEAQVKERNINNAEFCKSNKDNDYLNKCEESEIEEMDLTEEDCKSSCSGDNALTKSDMCTSKATIASAELNTDIESTNDREDEKKKKLDALYDKHSEERYWIHLRRFLFLNGVDTTEELEEFFLRSAEQDCGTSKDVLEENSCNSASENDSIIHEAEPVIAPLICNSESFSSNTCKASRKADEDSYENEERIEKFKRAEKQDMISEDAREKENENTFLAVKQEELDVEEVAQINDINIKSKGKKNKAKGGISQTSGLAWTLKLLQKQNNIAADTDEKEVQIESVKHPENQTELPLDNSMITEGENTKVEVSHANVGATNTSLNDYQESAKDNPLCLEVEENNSVNETSQDDQKKMVTTIEKDKNKGESNQKSEVSVDSKTVAKLKILKACWMYIMKAFYPVITDPLYGMIKLIQPSQPQSPAVYKEPEPSSQSSQQTKQPHRRTISKTQKKFSKWLHPVAFIEMGGCMFNLAYLKDFKEYEELRESQTIYQQVEKIGTEDLHVVTLNLHELKAEIEEDHCTEEEIWKHLTKGLASIQYRIKETVPLDIPKELLKYWAQRYRLFLKYDKGIKLDKESWFSVTPEIIAMHHAYRCKCNIVVDAFCGAGGNAIQLAETCNHVIAIDIDPEKIAIARHNASVYGVADQIDFIIGDFFKLAPSLKADVVYLSPPWGGIRYMKHKVYNVKALGGLINCEHLISTAKKITKNIAIFLPKNSDLYQIIELAGFGNSVDIEYSYVGNKVKALTAYYGDLVYL